MKLDRLFNVLVLGGALIASTTACGAGQTVPDKPPTEAPATAPSSNPAPAADGEEDSTAAEGDEPEEKKDGVCSWL